MRGLVRERLAAGDADDRVVAALTARYGDFIRLLPPVKPTTLPLWAAPLLFLALGGAAWVGAFRRRDDEVASPAVADAPTLPRASARQLLAALTVALGVAGGAYLALGRPDLPDRPVRPRLAERQGVDEAAIAEMEILAARLEDRLLAHPDEARAWAMLGRAYLFLGRPAQGAAALRRGVDLGETDAATQGDLAEAMVLRDQGVDAAAEEIFLAVLALSPDDPRAGYFLGVAALQRRDAAQALARWRRAAAAEPADSPWRRKLEFHIAQVAAMGGKFPAP
jgi:cytochrome c-type biogenesis protein CcmH